MILFDLDGTLSDARHRMAYALAREWDEFHKRGCEDPPYPAIVKMFHTLSIHYEMIIMTGRNERYRHPTQAWLRKHSLNCKALIMRADDDYRQDTEYKLRTLEEIYGDQAAVLAAIELAIDDRDHVVEAFRNYGIVTLQPRASDH